MLRHIPAVNFFATFPVNNATYTGSGVTTFLADCDISRRRCDIFRRLWRFPAMRHFPALQTASYNLVLKQNYLIKKWGNILTRNMRYLICKRLWVLMLSSVHKQSYVLCRHRGRTRQRSRPRTGRGRAPSSCAGTARATGTDSSWHWRASTVTSSRGRRYNYWSILSPDRPWSNAGPILKKGNVF